MKVYKFGGTSVGTPDRMKEVAGLIRENDLQKIVVLSAVAGTTNALVEIGDCYRAGNIEAANECLENLKTKYTPFVEILIDNSHCFRSTCFFF